jgi:hypothetical protein
MQQLRKSSSLIGVKPLEKSDVHKVFRLTKRTTAFGRLLTRDQIESQHCLLSEMASVNYSASFARTSSSCSVETTEIKDQRSSSIDKWTFKNETNKMMSKLIEEYSNKSSSSVSS